MHINDLLANDSAPESKQMSQRPPADFKQVFDSGAISQRYDQNHGKQSVPFIPPISSIQNNITGSMLVQSSQRMIPNVPPARPTSTFPTFPTPTRPSQPSVGQHNSSFAKATAQTAKLGQPDAASPHRDRPYSRDILPKQTTIALLQWLVEHHENPYPNDAEKAKFCQEFNMSPNQISTWFVNARRRVLRRLVAGNMLHRPDVLKIAEKMVRRGRRSNNEAFTHMVERLKSDQVTTDALQNSGALAHQNQMITQNEISSMQTSGGGHASVDDLETQALVALSSMRQN